MPCFDIGNEPIYETDDEFDDFNENLDDHCQKVGFKVDIYD